jgi:hypothetical protein
MLAGFPVSGVNVTHGQLICTDSPPALAQINANIALMRMTDIGTNMSRRLYYGIVSGHELGGRSRGIPSDIASGSLAGDAFGYSRPRHMHELGHALGLHHSVDSALGLTTNDYKKGYCGEVARITAPDFPFFAQLTATKVPALGDMHGGPEQLIFGYDRSAGIVVSPYRTADLMGYCGFRTKWRWPSVYTYTNLWLAISNRFRPAPVIHAMGLALEWRSYSVIRGTVNLTSGEAQFLPFTWLRTPHIPALPPPGEYQLEFIDGAGSIQQIIPFDLVTEETDYPAPMPETGSFLIPVPANPAIRQVRLRHKGASILSRSASPSPPVLRVLQPNGGETIGTGPVELQWTGSDADGDALSYFVQYSVDNGSSWETLAVDWSQTRYILDAGFLRSTTAGRIRVIASDGFNTAVDESDKPFTVLNHPPNASIRLPTRGTIFSGKQAVVLAAAASDMEDGPLPEKSMQWTSDVDGQIGVGRYLQRPATAFTEGPHLIRLTARDTNGLSGTDTVQIVIMRQVPSDLADLEVVIDEAEALLPEIICQARIENHGPTDAKQVQMTLDLPAGVVLLSATSSLGSCQNDSGTLRCSLGTLGADEEASIEIHLRCSDPLGGPLRLQVTTSSTDPVPSNNVADLALALAASPVQTDSVRLTLKVVGREIVLSWPASATGFVLESTDRLAGPDPWEVHVNIEQMNDEKVFRITPGEHCRFYRLRQK